MYRLLVPSFALTLTLLLGANEVPAAGATGLKVPMPQDLCAHPAQKRIRRRISAIMKRGMAKGLGAPMGRATLVPCQHGRLRFLRFSVGKRRILALVEEDQRPSYISGPSRKSGYVFVGRRFFYDMAGVWKALGKSARRLDEKAKAKLLVTAMMLRREPTMVFDKRQGDAATKHWPAARRAMALAPPGLTKSKGGLVLRAWTLSSYNERGVSCRYIKGWEVRLDDKTGPKVTRTHSYAAGRRRGGSCGKPLPRP